MARSLPKKKLWSHSYNDQHLDLARWDGIARRPFSDHGNNAGRSKQLKSKTKVRAYCLIPRKRKRMKTYQHTQTGTTILVCVGLMCLGFAIGSISRHALLLTTVLLATGMWIFRSLTVEISDTELAWHFGSGWLRKSVPLAEITSAKPIRTTFLNGWGIHNTSHGWLYNVSGYGAVAITMRSGKQFCIGTDEPEKLAGELNS